MTAPDVRHFFMLMVRTRPAERLVHREQAVTAGCGPLRLPGLVGLHDIDLRLVEVDPHSQPGKVVVRVEVRLGRDIGLSDSATAQVSHVRQRVE